MSSNFRACPAVRSFAPGRAFASAEEALEFARQASDSWRIPYCVYLTVGATWRQVARVEPAKGGASCS
jgi:hypothetical protein